MSEQDDLSKLYNHSNPDIRLSAKERGWELWNRMQSDAERMKPDETGLNRVGTVSAPPDTVQPTKAIDSASIADELKLIELDAKILAFSIVGGIIFMVWLFNG